MYFEYDFIIIIIIIICLTVYIIARFLLRVSAILIHQYVRLSVRSTLATC